jgi:hypothetical protein
MAARSVRANGDIVVQHLLPGTFVAKDETIGELSALPSP